MTTETAAARRAKEAADRERAWAEQWPEARERLRRAHHDIECEHDDDCMGDCTHDADAILSLMQSELLQLQVLQHAFENVQQSLAESLDVDRQSDKERLMLNGRAASTKESP